MSGANRSQSPRKYNFSDAAAQHSKLRVEKSPSIQGSTTSGNQRMTPRLGPEISYSPGKQRNGGVSVKCNLDNSSLIYDRSKINETALPGQRSQTTFEHVLRSESL